jgi:hypothetical protein
MSRWLLIAALGCTHAATPPGSPPGTTAPTSDAVPRDAPRALDDDLPRLAARSLQLYQDLAQVVIAGGDCATVATKIDALATTYAEVTAANARVLHAGHDKVKALKHELEPHQADFDAAAKAIAGAPAMSQCSQDAAFDKALDRLVGET